MLHPLIKRLDHPVLEVAAAWIGGNHRPSLGIRKLIISAPHNIHSGPRLDQSDLRMHVLRYAWRRMEGDCGPNGLNLFFADPIAAQKVARRIGAINFEAKLATSISVRQTDVVEHRSDVKQFRI